MYLSRVTLKPDIGHNSQLGKLLQNSTYNTHQLLWDLFDQPVRDFLYREEIAKEQVLDDSTVKGEPIYYLLSATSPKTSAPLFNVESKEFNPTVQTGQRFSFRLRANPVITRQNKRHDLVMDEQVVFYRLICESVGLSSEGKKSDLKARLVHADNNPVVMDWLCGYLNESRYFVNANRHQRVDGLLDLGVQEAVSRRLMKWLAENPTRSGVFSLCEQVVEDEFSGQEVTVPFFQYNGYRAHPLHERNNETKARFMSVDMSGELIVNDAIRFLDMIHRGIGPAKAFGCGLMLIRRL